MRYTPEELRDKRARFVMAFLAACERDGLPLDADAALDYAQTAWTVDFCVENYRARTEK